MPNGDLRYRRGEIWWVNLDPTVGSETAKKRPCVILQNDVGNARSDTTMVAPLLKGSKAYPFVVSIKVTAENGLDETRGIHLEQMRVVDNRRLDCKLGTLEDKYWSEIEKAVCIVLGFNAVFEP
ncbi:type II toxin-antitoxin system PemK/MazF family toxin [Chamaesiphon sp. VAR_48_metabat_135_sub]|uniref:type II toxin-antitoxin system PemK/MazF family toxin n=1 Tax=Chamaesiphon sp. VAR_48_metabat_135_sub TaxID=2964699 RepID=UPI00286A8BFC|nr:type II toxin-antitoxin system PemK/MazF family toxin [Chamaesiphon sp. VAR_48_metabat_135_sub]